MKHPRTTWWAGVAGWALGLAVLAAGPAERASAWQVPPADPATGVAPDGVQVLTRGPIHEAFAEPVVFDPQPGPVIPKAPPAPVEEMPPDQRPDGANVQWIPGYWAWDDSRNDFLWVSGVWRDIPPGRQWVPGYWAQADGGYRWVPGAWQPTAAAAGDAQYLPPPPASLEAGPNSPPPSPDATWSPGTWYWQDSNYVWRPGFWVPFQPDWTWVPAHYVWSPGGYLFVNGYWDLPLAQRGQPYAPVYFSQPLYRQPNYLYTPTVGLLAGALAGSLFVRPSYGQYYFGDYYAANNFRSGIYPWYSYHQSRYGYDPLFAHYAAVNGRRDPNWANQLHQDYQFRRDHPEARPPHTYNEYQRFVNNTTVVNRTTNVTRNLVFAQPANRITANPPQGVRYTAVNEARRRELVQQSAQVRQFREQRVRQEAVAARNFPRTPPAAAAATAAPPGFNPRRVDLPRSPIAAAPHVEGRGPTPPAHPTLPAFEPSARPRPAAEPIPRHEPHPEYRPPAQPAFRPQPQPAARPAPPPRRENPGRPGRRP